MNRLQLISIPRQKERAAEGNRTVEDFLKEHNGRCAEWITSMEDYCKKQLDLMESLDEIDDPTDEYNEDQLAGIERYIADPTVKYTKGKGAEWWRGLKDVVKGQINLLAKFREIDDPTVEDTRGICAEWIRSMEDYYKKQLDLMESLDEKDDPTDEYNEEPLAEGQLNVDHIKRTESMAIAVRPLDDLPGLPPEIRRMDKVSQQLYREALETGKEKVYNIRLMVVGHHDVGKTTLAKRILGEEVAEAPHVSTEGIEVHPRCVKIDLYTKQWIVEGTEHRYPVTSQLIMNLVSENVGHKSKTSMDGVNQGKKNSIKHLVKNTEQYLNDGIQQEGIGSVSAGGAFHEKSMLLYRREADTEINKTGSNSDLRDFVTKYRTMTHSEKVFSYVTMLDFAGHFLFYTTHQAFMSWRTLYLLVTDMSKALDDVVEDDKCNMSLNRNMKCSIKDYAVFWLNSIYSHGIPAEASPQCEGSSQREAENDEQDHRGEEKYPPVILVATHSDKVPNGDKKETKEEYFDSVRRILKKRPQRFLLQGYFALSNFGPDADIDVLKQKIVELAQKQDYWGEEIPGRWLVLEQKLMDFKRGGEKIIEYRLVEEINNLMDVKIEKQDELELFLRFEHDLGNIVFFSTQKLREKVILDPEWLMEGVKLLISPPQQVREDPHIFPQLYDFMETGRLTKSLIGHIWSEGEHEDFHKHQDHLLDLMEKLSIIAKSVEQDASVECSPDKEEYYWVPCVIYKTPPDHVKNPKQHQGMTSTSTLCFASKTKFIHVGVFHRLVASFLSKWSPAKQEEDGKYKLYFGCCEFVVNKCHNLLLTLNDYVILATMFRCSSEGEYPDNGLCSEVRNLISSTLTEITACICPNSKFEICVKCEKSSTDSLTGLHRIIDTAEKRCTCSIPNHPVKVETLLKLWEVHKRQSGVYTEMPASVQVPENSEGVSKQDLKDEEEFLQAIRNNDQKVEEMIQNQKIPKQSIMEAAVIQDGYSKGVQVALREMSKLLKSKISQATGVWCGYKPDDSHTPVFVVTLKNHTCILRKDEIPEPFNNYKIIIRHKYVPNDEERTVVEYYGGKRIRSEDVTRVNTCVATHTERLMREHSNLSIIRSCAVKAYGYLRREFRVIEDTCIVFYVPVKGIIPVGEKEFPRVIDGIVTDVREGEFVFYGGHNAMDYHEKLRIGCCITGDKIGSLGGFVDLPDGKIGCLTAAHVVLTHSQINHYIAMEEKEKRKLNDDLMQGNENIEIHQPTPNEALKPFGRVYTIALDKDTISVDAAIIQITDDQRKPETGRFPDGEFTNIGFTTEDPMLYTNGDILEDIGSQQSGSLVIKFGCTTGITRGYLEWIGTSVRQVDAWGNYCFDEMKGQYVVNMHNFADKGDSGALVFLCAGGNIRNLHAVGMVIGGSSTGCSCIITPIKAVFEKLGLTCNRFKVFPHRRLSQQETTSQQLTQPHMIEHLINVQQNMKEHLSMVEQNMNEMNRHLMIGEQNFNENKNERLRVEQDINIGLTTVEQRMEERLMRVEQNMNERLTIIEQKVNEGLTTVEQKVNEGLTTVEQNMNGSLMRVEENMNGRITRVEENINLGFSRLEDLLNPSRGNS